MTQRVASCTSQQNGRRMERDGAQVESADEEPHLSHTLERLGVAATVRRSPLTAVSTLM